MFEYDSSRLFDRFGYWIVTHQIFVSFITWTGFECHNNQHIYNTFIVTPFLAQTRKFSFWIDAMWLIFCVGICNLLIPIWSNIFLYVLYTINCTILNNVLTSRVARHYFSAPIILFNWRIELIDFLWTNYAAITHISYAYFLWTYETAVSEIFCYLFERVSDDRFNLYRFKHANGSNVNKH